MNLVIGQTMGTTVLLVLSVLSSAFLSALVLARNPWRRTHRVFAVLTSNVALWALGVLIIIHCHEEEVARAWIMITFAVAAFLPATFYQFVTVFPYQRFDGNRFILALLYTGAAVLVLSVHSSWYIRDLTVFPSAPPMATYGPIFYVFGAMVGISFLFTSINLARKLRETTGIQRRQLEHVIIAFYSSTGLATLTNVLAPVFQIGRLEVYGPCFMVLMTGGLAYAMVRYHLLDIWGIVTRTTVYAIVTSAVTLIFLGSITGVHWVFSSGAHSTILTALVAALAIVLVLQPLRERVQLFLDRLVMHKHYDVHGLIDRVSRTAAQTVKLPLLLEQVTRELQQTIGITVARVLLVTDRDSGTLTTEWSTASQERGRRTDNVDFLLEYLRIHDGPLVLEELLLSRTTEERAMLAKSLAEMDAYMLVPLKTTSGLLGVITLGEKDTREIYTLADITAVATLSGPLSTAIENARLYSRLEALNLHMERIMSSMRGGVVAVDESGTITTVNQEAREILGNIRAGQSLESIDAKVAEILRQTLRKRRPIRDIEMVIGGEGDEGIPVAMSSSCFPSGSSGSEGAMVLIYNMTQLKRLESNVQRADRLNSIGTMAAGMAHEIKNPLQSIKTFTQLLLERYDDADFRSTFAEVVPPEVQRIDTIVKRLLHFARPKPVSFEPHDARLIVDDVLALVENQTRKAGIEVETFYPLDTPCITGDDQQLHQVLLNLVLNAVEAMEESTKRVLRIRIFSDRTHLTMKRQVPLLDVPCVKIAVSDSGCGIPEMHMPQLFTPFFTTKDEGSGLGLSVVQQIMSEHEGSIDVRSAVTQGTTFTLTFPLVERAKSPERVGA